MIRAEILKIYENIINELKKLDTPKEQEKFLSDFYFDCEYGVLWKAKLAGDSNLVNNIYYLLENKKPVSYFLEFERNKNE